MKTPQKKKGFTLVETLVAVGILVAAITGAFSAAQSGLSSYSNSKNQAIAINLAQEAVEYIRATRDSNKMVTGNNWLTGIEAGSGGACAFNSSCIVNVLNTSQNASCAGACPVLKQDPSTGYYGYTSGWPNTIFTREVLLTAINSPGCVGNQCKEISVLVTVKWNKGVTTKIYKTREYLFNW